MNLKINDRESSSISDIEFLIFKDNINNDDKLNIILTEKQLKEKRLKHGKINVVGLLIQKIGFGILSSITYLSVYYIAYLSYKDKTIKLENSITLSSIYTLAECSSIWIGGILKKTAISLGLIVLVPAIFNFFTSIVT